MKIKWPDNKDFAFTIFDDTDNSELPEIATVYQFLEDLGMRTTKSIWPILGEGTPEVGGATCEDHAYLAWAQGLQERGFEIGLHNVSFCTSSRATTIRGLQRFQELFGHSPYSLANHTGCDESIYWGSARLTGLNRFAYDLLTGFQRRNHFRGHVPGDPLFWGDVCQDQITAVRNFVFAELNTLKACPWMPYHDADRPFVRSWFASSEAPGCRTFCTTVAESAQDQLAEEHGASIIYTHLASGFCTNGKLDPTFRALMERLGRKNGWFVPVQTLLSHLATVKGVHELSPSQRRQMERKWLFHKIKTGSS